MLQQINGTCANCSLEFGKTDSQQSVKNECSKCKNEINICRSCKEKGCECGGKYLYFWDKNPEWMI